MLLTLAHYQWRLIFLFFFFGQDTITQALKEPKVALQVPESSTIVLHS